MFLDRTDTPHFAFQMYIQQDRFPGEHAAPCIGLLLHSCTQGTQEQMTMSTLSEQTPCLPEHLLEVFSTRKDRVALVFPEGQYSYGKMLEGIRRTAGWYQRRPARGPHRRPHGGDRRIRPVLSRKPVLRDDPRSPESAIHGRRNEIFPRGRRCPPLPVPESRHVPRAPRRVEGLSPVDRGRSPGVRAGRIMRGVSGRATAFQNRNPEEPRRDCPALLHVRHHGQAKGRNDHTGEPLHHGRFPSRGLGVE